MYTLRFKMPIDERVSCHLRFNKILTKQLLKMSLLSEFLPNRFILNFDKFLNRGPMLF